jgi:hypothetical protein
MPLLEILIIFPVSFLGYGIAYFTTTNMKSVIRFDWENLEPLLQF